MSRKLLASAAAAALLVSGAALANEPGQMPDQGMQTKAQTDLGAMNAGGDAAASLDTLRTEDIVGMTVTDKAGEEVGTIGSVVLGGHRRVDAVILEQGGFLGLGEDELVVGRGHVAGVTKDGMTLDLSKEEVAALPRHTTDLEATATAAPSAAGHPPTARDLVGKDVFSANGEDVGEVADVLVNDQGEPEAVVIAHGGWLGLGEKKIAVDWSSVTVAKDGVAIDLPSQQLSQIPEYRGATQ
jgi:sporulation protein YlmC with PRC-barrel domain